MPTAVGRGRKKGMWEGKVHTVEKLWNPVDILSQTLYLVNYSLTSSEQHYSSCLLAPTDS